MSFRVYLAAFAILALVTGAASAHSVKIGALTLTDLWTRATPPKAPTGGGYLTITNADTEPDRLVAVSSPLAGMAQLHQMEMKDGVMTMRPIEGGIEIPAGGSVTLAPDGMHIMFMDLKGAFVDGGKLPITLSFEKAGSIETFLHIRPIGADGPGDMPSHGTMKMD